MSKKRRRCISMSQADYDRLREICEETGSSMSAWMAGQIWSHVTAVPSKEPAPHPVRYRRAPRIEIVETIRPLPERDAAAPPPAERTPDQIFTF